MRACIVLAGALTAWLPARAEPPNVSAELGLIYQAEEAALARKDAEGALAADLDDATHVGRDGAVKSHDQAVADLKAVLGQIVSATSQSRPIQVVAIGDTGRAHATVLTTARLILKPTDENMKITLATAGFDTIPLIIKSSSMDDWQRTPNGWRLEKSQEIVTSAAIDPAFLKDLAAKQKAAR